MVQFLVWAMVASVVAGVYLFGVFPAVHDFGLLALVLAVAFLPLGLLLHHPKSALFALPLTVNLAALLSLQNTYSANIQTFLNSSIAMFIGIGFAVVMTRLFRSVGAEGPRAGWCGRAGPRWPKPPKDVASRIGNASPHACSTCWACSHRAWQRRRRAATSPPWTCSTRRASA